MVYTTGSGALTIPANARLHSEQAWYKNSTAENKIVLIARDPAGNTAQETRISFDSEATEDFDLAHDSYFMAGFAPMFYSINQNKHFVLNTLPELTDELVIPLGFVKNENNSFVIELEQGIAGQTLYLFDLKTNIEHKISESSYSFTSESSDNANRFLLKFKTVGINETPAVPTIQAWFYGGNLTIKTCEGSATIDILNIQGQNLQNFQKRGGGIETLQINLPAGAYFVRIVNEGNMKTVKMIVD